MTQSVGWRRTGRRDLGRFAAGLLAFAVMTLSAAVAHDEPAVPPQTGAAPAAPAPRSELLTVNNVVNVHESEIVLVQEQIYRGDFIKLLWDRLDANKDGKLSKEERDGGPQALKSNYTDYTDLRVNWFLHAPQRLAIDVSAVPAKLPKNLAKAAPVKVTFSASYPYIPAPSPQVDLIELIQGNINAHEVNAQFLLQTGMDDQGRITRRRRDRIYRTNIGELALEGLSAVNMKQLDGRPGVFSAILSREPKPQAEPAAGQ